VTFQGSDHFLLEILKKINVRSRVETNQRMSMAGRSTNTTYKGFT